MTGNRSRNRRRLSSPSRVRRLLLEQYEARMLLSGLAPLGQDVIVTTLEDKAYVIQRSDFGFSDANDTPQDVFIAVKITTIPQAGSLTDNGNTISAGQYVPVADIDNAKLQFIAAANGNGIAYASFTFQVQDSGTILNGSVDLDPTPNLFTINVTPVNDPPVTSGGFEVYMSAGSSYVFSASFGLTDWHFSDPNDQSPPSSAPPNTMQAVKITTLPAKGALTYNNGTVAAGQFISTADLLAGKLRFTPTTGEAAFQYTSFTFQVQDNGGTADGGKDLSLTPGYFSFDVIARAPAGKDSTVNIFENQFYIFSGADFFPGPDAVPPIYNLTAVKIVSLPALGTLSDNGVPVAVNQFVPATDVTNGKLRYTPPPNSSGQALTKINFQVQDDGGTFDNRSDVDLTANTITLNVAPLNHANQPPSGNDKSITLLKNATRVFAAADFGFSDANEIPSNHFLAVKIAVPPAAGSLTNNSAVVTAGQFVSLADINAGKLQFSPATDASGIPYATFTFQVQDDGGTTNGGLDLDPTPNTITLSVSSSTMNHAPSAQNGTVTGLEDTDYTFQLADFGFSDALDLPQNSFLSLKLITAPSAGLLVDNHLGVSAGHIFPAANIAAGKVLFSPRFFKPDANGSPFTSFTFQVQDDGGTANGGLDASQTVNTMTVNVLSVNDAPRGSNRTIATPKDTPYTFVATDFSFTDPYDVPPNNLQAVKLASLPAAGLVTDNGAAVAIGQMVPVTDISAGRFVFIPATGGMGQPYAAFGFQVQDDGGTANGGIDLDPNSHYIYLNVGTTAPNHAPAGTDTPVGVSEDSKYTFTAADFGFTDPSDPVPNNFVAVKITTLPAKGTLADNNVAVPVGQFVPMADLSAGKLTFKPAPSDYGNPYTSFTFQVQDDGGTANGGVDLDATPNTVTMSVFAVNHPPTGFDRTVNWQSSAPYTFSIFDFGFADFDLPANSFLAVKITTLPTPTTAGTLNNNGLPVAAGQYISVSLISAGLLKFTPAAGNPFCSFTFQVQDNGGIANGGSDLDPTPNTLSFGFAPYPPPNGSDTTVTTLEDTHYTFATTDFYQKAPFQNDPPSHGSPTPNLNNLLAVKVVTLPLVGSLANNGLAVAVNQLVPAADIAAGKLTFLPAANANGAPLSMFAFQVQDDGGTTVAGRIDLDPSPNTITINVTPVNDEPTGQDKTVVIEVNSLAAIQFSDFGFTDPNDVPPNKIAGVVITTVPAQGVLVVGTDVGPNLDVRSDPTFAIAYSGMFVPAPNGLTSVSFAYQPPVNTAGDGIGSFTFQVKDNGGTANGGVDLDSIPNTLTISVGSMNHPPVGTDRTVTTVANSPYVFTTTDFPISDPKDTPPNNLLSVQIATLPLAGTLTDNGQPVTVGQRILLTDIAAAKLQFTPAANAGGLAYASFSFRVQDDGGVANSGLDTSLASNTMTINVTPICVPPPGPFQFFSVYTLEDVPYAFHVADFPILWSDDHLTGLTVVSSSTVGKLTDNGAPVIPGQTVSLSDIAQGLLVYTLPANANPSPPPSITFQTLEGGGVCASQINSLTPTAQIVITPVNDPPAGSDRNITAEENVTYAFQRSDFGFSDPNDNPANNFGAVKIASVPALGSLTLANVPVFVGLTIPIADIDSGLLRYVPPINRSGSALAAFDFQVQDNGGTANGGVDTDTSPNTITISIPRMFCGRPTFNIDNSVLAREDTPYIFTNADLSLTGAQFEPSPTTLVIETLPTQGSLQYNNTPVVAGQSIPSSDIAGGRLQFVPPKDSSGSALATFEVALDDGICTSWSATGAITINVLNANDPPEGMDRWILAAQDTRYVIAPWEFGFTDPNDSPPNSLKAVKITTLSGLGTLSLHDVPVSAGQVIPIVDVASGLLRYIPPPGAIGDELASFTFQVQDDGGTTNGGIDTDPTPNTISISVDFVCDHRGSQFGMTVSALEDTPYIFSAHDLGLTGDALALGRVEIQFLPALGILRDNGVPVLAYDIIPESDVNNGLVSYTPPAQSYGPEVGSFAFAPDPGFGCGSLSGGIMSIDVAPVNDRPSFTAGANQSVLDTSGPRAVDGWAKPFSFGPPNEAGQKVHFLVTNDQLTLFATQPAVDSTGKLTFAPALKASGIANVTVVAVDDGGTANGGLDTSQPQTFTIGVSLAEPFHNRIIAADVTGDNKVVAEDAVDVINFINAHGSGPVMPAQPGDLPPLLLYDVTGDDYVAADDVMTIINYINAHPKPQPEASQPEQPATNSPDSADDALLTLLAADVATQSKRRGV